MLTKEALNRVDKIVVTYKGKEYVLKDRIGEADGWYEFEADYKNDVEKEAYEKPISQGYKPVTIYVKDGGYVPTVNGTGKLAEDGDIPF